MLRVRLLGGLALERDGDTVALPPSRRSRLLAGWLALHPGLHAREALAGRLRPDVLDDSARQSLRQAAWGLRAAVGDDLVATRDAIGFGGTVEVDVRVFDAARRRATSTPRSRSAAVSSSPAWRTTGYCTPATRMRWRSTRCWPGRRTLRRT